MKKRDIFLGNTSLKKANAQVKGEFVNIQDEKFYKISNFNLMPDFFMTLVSNSNHWMFISSNGSLSAGRKNRDNALFPYYSDDKIHDYCGITGSKTLCIVEKDGRNYLWEPFSKELSGLYSIQRNIYKNIYGNKIIFEEYNKDLGVGFQYSWLNSEKFGFVKKSTITNFGKEATKIEILDGIRNILPSGIDYIFQNEYSNLSDAYKKAELLKETKLGLFMLSSIPVDRAEPSESLKATSVWSYGRFQSKILISDKQLENFKQGHELKTETDIRAARGAYFVNAELVLEKHQTSDWFIVSEVNQDSTKVANLNLFLKGKEIEAALNSDIEKGTQNLIKIVGGADGLQLSNEELSSARHFSNTLFNVMRGGVYHNNYTLNTVDFIKFVHDTNKKVFQKFEPIFDTFSTSVSEHELFQMAEESGDRDLLRICYEYLPLTFSRRHGDPSRPWNQFSIENKNEDGSPKLDFQGNWRDIFQNWEALSFSYPGFIENIISKFVNASTPDGYNPYRIMRDGIDWECPDPDDPWAYIGYWGDHQIIYLQKLLELSENYHPGKLDELLVKEIFAYANVPYRIKPYSEIIKNPQDTITFDFELNEKIKNEVDVVGADGRLLIVDNHTIYKVNLTEKILVTLLSKLSNFIPEAGIWLNTQRPEWNDANNALVGSGVSMVTLNYLRRFVKFWNDKFRSLPSTLIHVSAEVKELFNAIFSLFTENTDILKQGFSDSKRRYFADKLGEAGSVYRDVIYRNSFSTNKKVINSGELAEFTSLALAYIDQSIRVNKRDDGLFHAYNLISFSKEGISIRYLYEMLEGQVAALSSGLLNAEESLEVLNALKKSALFRKDQYSYLLYPDRELPRFVEKNNIPAEKVKQSKLLSKLIAENDKSIVSVDGEGNAHFNGNFRNAQILSDALKALNTDKYAALVEAEKDKLLATYEAIFDHQSFTGRSGTFYGYEGLGSIYWHMVSKLLLATEECFFKAIDENADPEITGQLKNHFYEIKAGIGLYKSPELYGAFPTDPYSHSPGNAGVKQPGMTGQVKEDFISRMGEIGVRIQNGQIVFDTHLINEDEYLDKESVFEYINVKNKHQQLLLDKDQLGFTICQVPVIYSRNGKKETVVTYANAKTLKNAGNKLSNQTSEMIFKRTGEVERIEVHI